MFRKYDKIISATSLANRQNNYLINWLFKSTNPTSLYTSRLTNNKLSEDPFELSLLSYHLVRKSKADAALNELAAKDNSEAIKKFTQHLEIEQSYNSSLLDKYIQQLKVVISYSPQDLPVHTAIGAYYSMQFAGKADTQFCNQYLLPVIAQKIQYASLANLADLVEALNNAKSYSNTGLWKKIGEQVNTKASEPKFQEVVYNAWSLDQYEADGQKKKPTTRVESSNQHYYNDLKSGGELLANAKREVRKVLNMISNQALRRLFTNEGRITTTLDQFDEKVEVDDLVRNLEEAANNVGEAGAQLKSASSKLRE